MLRYLALTLSFFRASLMSDLEYRLNILVKIITDIFWYASQLAIFEVVFRTAPQLAGWTLPSVRVFMAILFIVDAVYMILFSENLDRLSDRVRRGDLDLLLSKPVNSQFMMSTQRMNSAYVFNLIMATSFLVWSLNHLESATNTHLFWQSLQLLVLIPCGVILVYCCRLFFASTAIIFSRSEAINYIWYTLYRIGTRPDSLYPNWLRYMILSFIPVAFIASVPARLIIGGFDPILFFGAVVLAIVFLYLSTKWWNFTLKFYSSASS